MRLTTIAFAALALVAVVRADAMRPSIRSEDETVTRARRAEEALSIWDVEERLKALETAGFADFEAGLMAKLDAALDVFDKEIDATLAKTITDSTATMNARLTALDNKLDDVTSSVFSAVQSATAGIRREISMAGSKVDDLAQDVQAEFNAWEAINTRASSECIKVAEAGTSAVEASKNSALASVASSKTASLNQINGVKNSVNTLLGSATKALNLPMLYRTMSHINNGCDNCELFSVSFNKKYDDTALEISFNGGARIIGHGHACRWFFRVDNNDCRDNSGSSRGHIDTRFHGSHWRDLHRVMHLQGVCYRHSRGVINKGKRKISMHVEGNGDCYTGWSSNNRFKIMEVIKPPNQSG